MIEVRVGEIYVTQLNHSIYLRVVDVRKSLASESFAGEPYAHLYDFIEFETLKFDKIKNKLVRWESGIGNFVYRRGEIKDFTKVDIANIK